MNHLSRLDAFVARAKNPDPDFASRIANQELAAARAEQEWAEYVLIDQQNNQTAIEDPFKVHVEGQNEQFIGAQREIAEMSTNLEQLRREKSEKRKNLTELTAQVAAQTAHLKEIAANLEATKRAANNRSFPPEVQELASASCSYLAAQALVWRNS